MYQKYDIYNYGVLNMSNNKYISKLIDIGSICLEINIGTKLILNKCQPCSKHMFASDFYQYFFPFFCNHDDYVNAIGVGPWKAQ